MSESESRQNIDENKELEIQTETSQPDTIDVNNKEVERNDPISSIPISNELDINSKHDEMSSNPLNTDDNNPDIVNELHDDNQTESPNFSAIVNDDKQTSSPDISIISNEDRQINSLNISSNTSNDGDISSTLNDDKQPIISNTSNDGDISSTSNEDKQTTISNTSNDGDIPSTSNGDKQTTISNTSNDVDIPSTSNEDKQTTISNTSNDVDIPTSNEDKQTIISNTSNDGDIPSTSNDDKQTTISNTSNDDDIPSTSNNDKQPTISNNSNDGDISSTSNDDDQTNPPNILNDDNSINPSNYSPTTSNDVKSSYSPTIQNDDKSFHLSAYSSTTSNDDRPKHPEENYYAEPNQHADTNLHNDENTSKHNYTSNEDDNDSDKYEMINEDTSIYKSSEWDLSQSGYAIVPNFNEKLNHETSQLADTNVHNNEDVKNSPSKFRTFDIDPKYSESINPINTGVYNNEFESSPFKHNSTSNDDDDVDSPEELVQELINQKEDYEPVQPEIHFNELKNDSSNQNYISNVLDPYAITNESEKNKVQVENQQIRERRRPNQQQEDDTLLKSSNIKVVKMTDTYHPVISFFKIFKYAALSVFVFVFIKYFIYDIYVTNKKPSPFRKIADITNNIFEEMNNVELPAVSTISEHTVKCRVAANTLERSLTFKSYGNSIATGLRDIGKEIREAGVLLQKMYSKGSSLQTSFDIEIGAIKHRLNSKSNYMQQDDASYIKERLDILMKKIKELRLLVEKGHNHILDAMKIRSDINDDIKNGLGAADKYSNNTKHSADIVRAKKELADVDKVLSESIIIVGHLQRLRDILNDYGNKLMDVSDELDEMGNEGRRVTKKDLKQLTLAVDHSKAHHHKFNKLAQVPD